MWTYLWFFVALVLGFLCIRFYDLYREYEYRYRGEIRQCEELKERYLTAREEVRAQYSKERGDLIQHCVTALRHPHPETVEIINRCGEDEIYRQWGRGGPPPNYRPFSCYFMYRDGRIIYRPEGFEAEKVIWPKSREHLRQFFTEDADLLWLYIKLYREFIEAKRSTPASR